MLAGVLGWANILLQSRGGSSSESPFASDAGEATARYEVPYIVGWQASVEWSPRAGLFSSMAVQEPEAC